MSSIYKTMKDAAPDAMQHLIEITGHVMAPHRGELAEWCRTVGIGMDEFDGIVRSYREDIGVGTRIQHRRHF